MAEATKPSLSNLVQQTLKRPRFFDPIYSAALTGIYCCERCDCVVQPLTATGAAYWFGICPTCKYPATPHGDGRCVHPLERYEENEMKDEPTEVVEAAVPDSPVIQEHIPPIPESLLRGLRNGMVRVDYRDNENRPARLAYSFAHQPFIVKRSHEDGTDSRIEERHTICFLYDVELLVNDKEGVVNVMGHSRIRFVTYGEGDKQWTPGFEKERNRKATLKMAMEMAGLARVERTQIWWSYFNRVKLFNERLDKIKKEREGKVVTLETYRRPEPKQEQVLQAIQAS